MSTGSFAIGTAHRSPVQRTPVIHILVPGTDDWAMWCSGGKGREDSPYGNRLCRTCRRLAREAVGEGVLDASEVGGEWFTDKQAARDAAARNR